MKGMKTRLVSLLLAVSLILSLAMTGASAAVADQSGQTADALSKTEAKTPFADVAAGRWYEEAVAYVYDNGLMNGTATTTFEPQTNLTRAMFVTILGRMAGVDTSYPTDSAEIFRDVKQDSWYEPYVAWAVEWGVVNGMTTTTFGPQNQITREQMATIISRYLKNTGIALQDSDSAVSSFKDSATVSSYATEGLELMRRTGIITGDTNGNFNPKNSATRAEAATVMMRLDQAVEESGESGKEICEITLVYGDDNGTWGSRYLAEGAVLSEPTMTGTKYGYQFDGWYLDSACTTPYDFSQPVTGDLVLYGGWTELDEYTFILTVYWPDGEVEYYTGKWGELLYDVIPVREIEGKTFVGYYTSAEYDCVYSELSQVVDNRDIYPKYRDNVVEVNPSDSIAKYLTVGGTTYYIGQAASELGTPNETLSSSYGFTWYVYGTGNYKNFFAAGVDNGTVVALVAAGPGFNYQGMTCGSQKGEYVRTGYSVTISTDDNDNNIVHGVRILSTNFRYPTTTDAAALAGESKMIFHLTNAFRVYHGLNALTWSTQAATAARLHSEDMAAQDYFSHDSLDGRTFSQRLIAQGISYRGGGENIAGGDLYDGYDAYEGWIDSAGHRGNMLKDSFNYLGVGGGFNGAWFYTQDFYR